MTREIAMPEQETTTTRRQPDAIFRAEPWGVDLHIFHDYEDALVYDREHRGRHFVVVVPPDCSSRHLQLLARSLCLDLSKARIDQESINLMQQLRRAVPASGSFAGKADPGKPWQRSAFDKDLPDYARLQVTELVLMQYLTRQKGLDRSALYEEIMPQEDHDRILAAGDGEHAVGDRRYIVRAGRVVTAL